MLGVDLIAEILKREGIEILPCYPAQPLIDAAAKVGIRPIICRQERMGMAIADGFSRTTNGKRLGVFASQQGPGTENAFPGAAQAFSDNVPILIIAGGEPISRVGVAPGFSAVDNYRHVTKWAAHVNYVERIPELMRRAFYQLRTGKGGPVLLEVAQNVWNADFDGDLDYTPVRGNKTGPDPDDVTDAAAVLHKAGNLLIQAGQGCLYAEASEELVEFAELLQAPVMTTMPGKSAFPEDHPLALGASSVSYSKQTAHFLEKADVIFAIGTSLTRTNYGKKIPSDRVIVHSTNDPMDVNKEHRADYALLGDTKLVLRALIEEMKTLTDGSNNRNGSDSVAEVKKVRIEWEADWMPHLTSDEVPINQYRIVRDTMNVVDRANTIVTHDAGSPRDQVTPFWESTVPRTYMGWGKSTQLGYGLGIIMGAKVAEPDKLCINFMGDAAIGMVGMDIETAVRNKIGILTIVFDNGIMAIERDHQPFTADTMNSLDLGGDYVKIADGLGAWSKRVDHPDDFVTALKEAIEVTKTGQPALLDCIVKEGYDFSKY